MLRASAVERIGMKYDDRTAKIPHEVKQINSTLGPGTVDKAFIAGYRGELDALEHRDTFKLQYAKRHGETSYRNLPAINKVKAAIEYLDKHTHMDQGTINAFKDGAQYYSTDKELNSYANEIWAAEGIGGYKSAWDNLVKQTTKTRTKAK